MKMALGDVQDVSFYTKELCSPDVTVQTSLVYQQRLPFFQLEQEWLPAKFHGLILRVFQFVNKHCKHTARNTHSAKIK